MPTIEISLEIATPSKFADVITINGTDKILSKLTTAVKVIDSATSPFANFVNTLDVTPPGAAAIIIKPIAIGVGKLSDIATQKATIGKSINWQINPTKKSFGYFNILVKSLIERPSPSPSIIIAKTSGAIFVNISITIIVQVSVNYFDKK